MYKYNFLRKSYIKTAEIVKTKFAVGTAQRMKLYHAVNALKLRIQLGKPMKTSFRKVIKRF